MEAEILEIYSISYILPPESELPILALAPRPIPHNL